MKPGQGKATVKTEGKGERGQRVPRVERRGRSHRDRVGRLGLTGKHIKDKGGTRQTLAWGQGQCHPGSVADA